MSVYDVEVKAGGACVIEAIFRDESRKPIDLSAADKALIKIRRQRSGASASLSAEMEMVNKTAPEGHPDRGRLRYPLTAAKSAELGPGVFELEVLIDWGDDDPSIAPGWGYRLLRIWEAVST